MHYNYEIDAFKFRAGKKSIVKTIKGRVEAATLYQAEVEAMTEACRKLAKRKTGTIAELGYTPYEPWDRANEMGGYVEDWHHAKWHDVSFVEIKEVPTHVLLEILGVKPLFFLA